MSAPRPLTSLRIGDRVIVRCDDGPLEMEYALFDPGEVVLHSADRLTVREAGYLTTAAPSFESLEVRKGSRVWHERFGDGEVLSVSQGPEPAVVAFFPGWGQRKVLAKYLKFAGRE